MKHYAFGLFIIFSLNIYGQYSSDILGGNYVNREIKCADDSEGEVLATLIKKETQIESKVAILYVHGFNDYFFQKHVGDSIESYGFNFYAIDLRKYGRSLRLHQTRYDAQSLFEYHEELDSALNIINHEGNDSVILFGHSTGGLIVSHYYLHREKDSRIKGLILNSPFFDFNLNKVIENLGVDYVSHEGLKHPEKEMKQSFNPNYGESLHKSFKGEWEYNLEWKPIVSPSVKYGWIRAIHLAQNEVKLAHFNIPVLLLSSDKSYKKKKWSEDIHIKDAVLDVKDIKRIGKKLSSQLDYVIIPKGKHDLSLSNQRSREYFFESIKLWLSK